MITTISHVKKQNINVLEMKIDGKGKPICYRIKWVKNIEHLTTCWHLFTDIFLCPIFLPFTWKIEEKQILKQDLKMRRAISSIK
jgi:hypothetical protein